MKEVGSWKEQAEQPRVAPLHPGHVVSSAIVRLVHLLLEEKLMASIPEEPPWEDLGLVRNTLSTWPFVLSASRSHGAMARKVGHGNMEQCLVLRPGLADFGS